jgi:hypothetical protein
MIRLKKLVKVSFVFTECRHYSVPAVTVTLRHDMSEP